MLLTETKFEAHEKLKRRFKRDRKIHEIALLAGIILLLSDLIWLVYLIFTHL